MAIKFFESVHINYTKFDKMIMVEISTFFYHKPLIKFWMPISKQADYKAFYKNVKYRAKKQGIIFNHSSASGVPY